MRRDHTPGTGKRIAAKAAVSIPMKPRRVNMGVFYCTVTVFVPVASRPVIGSTARTFIVTAPTLP